MNIRGSSITLRAVERDDLASLHRWSNDPDVQRGLGGWHFPLSLASLDHWISGFRYDSSDQRFIIESGNAGAIGMVTLTGINWKDRNATEGVLIGEARYRRMGHARDAVLTLMRYAFEELGLQRLDTTIVEFNTASLALHVERCGWKLEGRKECAVYRMGRFWPAAILGITRDEYATHREAGLFGSPAGG